MRFQVVPAAYVFLRRTEDGGDQLLLQLREGTGYMDGHWAAAAAGHVEAGESVFDAAVREAAEELGITIDPSDLVPLCAMHRTSPPHGPSTSGSTSSSSAAAGAGSRGSRRPTSPSTCGGSTSTRYPNRSSRTSTR